MFLNKDIKYLPSIQIIIFWRTTVPCVNETYLNHNVPNFDIIRFRRIQESYRHVACRWLTTEPTVTTGLTSRTPYPRPHCFRIRSSGSAVYGTAQYTVSVTACHNVTAAVQPVLLVTVVSVWCSGGSRFNSKRLPLTSELNSPNHKSVRTVTITSLFLLPRHLRRRSAAARLLKLWVRILPGAWMSVCCEYYVLSRRGLCDELITRPEESYRLRCVVVCDLYTSWLRRSWPTGGWCAK
jgi:hypothetical protein